MCLDCRCDVKASIPHSTKDAQEYLFLSSTIDVRKTAHAYMGYIVSLCVNIEKSIT